MQSASDILRAVMKAESVSINRLADMVGRSPNAVYARIQKGTMPVPVWLEWLDMLGYEVVVRKKGTDQLAGGRRRGVGARLRGMVGKVIYDTNKADAICHTPERDGWFIEVYRDDSGRFFAAHYTNWITANDFITAMDIVDAYRLYLTYGDGSIDEYFEGVTLVEEESE